MENQNTPDTLERKLEESVDQLKDTIIKITNYLTNNNIDGFTKAIEEYTLLLSKTDSCRYNNVADAIAGIMGISNNLWPSDKGLESSLSNTLRTIISESPDR